MYRVLVFYVLHLYVGLCAKRDEKFFRKDYTYLEQTDSFYKVHDSLKTWNEAKALCELESASFFYPENQKEFNALLAYWNQTRYLFPFAFIGVSSLRVKGVFETVDGNPITDVYSKWDVGEPNDVSGEENCVILKLNGLINDDRCDKKYHFICKKKRASLEWNPHCHIPNMDYVYSVTFGKCYKFHTNPQSWNVAFEICAAEQSYLAIIDTPAEANLLKEFTDRAPKDDVMGSFVRGAVLLGFHNKQGDGWKTVKAEDGKQDIRYIVVDGLKYNHSRQCNCFPFKACIKLFSRNARKYNFLSNDISVKLKDSGYSKWSYSQPDGGDHEKCGSMFYDSDLNDFGCDSKAFFICEHDVDDSS